MEDRCHAIEIERNRAARAAVAASAREEELARRHESMSDALGAMERVRAHCTCSNMLALYNRAALSLTGSSITHSCCFSVRVRAWAGSINNSGCGLLKTNGIALSVNWQSRLRLSRLCIRYISRKYHAPGDGGGSHSIGSVLMLPACCRVRACLNSMYRI
jgi:hypothetical protein